MASPQVENGMTSLANELVEALAKTQLSPYESRFLWALWRKTYGWHKTEDWISGSQIMELTGLRKQHVWRTKKILIDRHIVTPNGYKISFQKDYTLWIDSKVTKRGYHNKVTNSGISVTNRGTEVTNRGGHKVNYTKETYTKERGGILNLTTNQKAFLKRKYPNADIDKLYDKFRAWQKANARSYPNVLEAFKVWLIEDNTKNKPGEVVRL